MKTPREGFGPMKRAMALEMIHREVVGIRTGHLALSIWRTNAARVWKNGLLIP
jgi:hypothetical protein